MSFEEEAAWNRLQDVFRGTGVVLQPSGLIEMIAPRKRAEEACARYLLALTQLVALPVVQTASGAISFDLRVDGGYVNVLSIDDVRSHVGKVEALRLERPDVQTLAVVIDEADASGRAVAEMEAIGGAVPVMLLSELVASALRPKRQP